MDCEDQTYGCIKKYVIMARLARSSRHVGAINIERRIVSAAKVIHPRATIRWHGLRERRKGGRGISKVCTSDRFAQGLLCFPHEQIDMPWLGIEVARCRARRFKDFHQQMPRHWIRPERTNRSPRTDCSVEDLTRCS